jgi:hypothetical protein
MYKNVILIKSIKVKARWLEITIFTGDRNAVAIKVFDVLGDLE